MNLIATSAYPVSVLVCNYITGNISDHEIDMLRSWMMESEENRILFQQLTDKNFMHVALACCLN